MLDVDLRNCMLWKIKEDDRMVHLMQGGSATSSVTRHLRLVAVIKGVVENHESKLAATKEGLPVLARRTMAVEEEGGVRCFLCPVQRTPALLLAVCTVQALDNIKFESLTDKSKLYAQPVLFVHIVPDKATTKLTFIYISIGMTKSDLVKNLGTIARSSTKDFMQALAAGADMPMIGQVGVCFYSAYLVDEIVAATSKHNDDEQYVWESRALAASP